MKFKFNNGYIGSVPEAVAKTLQARKEGSIVSAQPELIEPTEKAEKTEKKGKK